MPEIADDAAAPAPTIDDAIQEAGAELGLWERSEPEPAAAAEDADLDATLERAYEEVEVKGHLETARGRITLDGVDWGDVTQRALAALKAKDPRIERLTSTVKVKGADAKAAAAFHVAAEDMALELGEDLRLSRMPEARAIVHHARRKVAALEADKTRFPHFQEVRQTMAHLMMANRQLSIEDAYEKACWVNDGTREKMQAAEAAKAAKVAKVKAKAAPAPSIDEILEAEMERRGMLKPSKRIPIR